MDTEAPAVIEDKRPSPSWPHSGAIWLQDVQLRYRKHLPLVLKSMSFEVGAREKIGIVGRTGSGV